MPLSALELRVDLLQAIEALEDACYRMAEQWHALDPEQVVSFWCDTPGDMTQALTNLHYGDDEPAQAVIRYPGVIRGDAAFIAEMKALNGIKQRVQHALDAIYANAKSKGRNGKAHARTDEVVEILQTAGRARLQLVRATRRFPIVDERINRLCFYWRMKRRGHRRITVASIRKRADSGDPLWIAAASELDEAPAEERLVIKKPSTPTLNLTVLRPSGDPLQRTGSVPVIISQDHPVPEITIPTQEPSVKTDRDRTSTKFMEPPISEALHLYRYLPEFA